jgi:hypothetical protein
MRTNGLHKAVIVTATKLRSPVYAKQKFNSASLQKWLLARDAGTPLRCHWKRLA